MPSQLDTVHQCTFATANAVHTECRRRMSGQFLLLVFDHHHGRQRILLLSIAGLG
jgi:hypothetical protein